MMHYDIIPTLNLLVILVSDNRVKELQLSLALVGFWALDLG